MDAATEAQLKASMLLAMQSDTLSPEMKAMVQARVEETIRLGKMSAKEQEAYGNSMIAAQNNSSSSMPPPPVQPQYVQPPKPAAPVAAAPAGPPPLAASLNVDASHVTVTLPDNTMIGWNRLTSVLSIKGRTSTLLSDTLHARPVLCVEDYLDDISESQVLKEAVFTKLGWKNAFGDSWQPRLIRLRAKSLSYAKPNEPDTVIKVIPLSRAVTTNVLQASSPARANRYESSAEAPLSESSGTIGKDHCLEVCVLGRTFYLSANTDAEAMQWKEAIDNCVRALPSSFDELPRRNPQEEPDPFAGMRSGQRTVWGTVKFFIPFAGLVSTLTRPAPNDPSRYLEHCDPTKTVKWYRKALGGQYTGEQIYKVIIAFYDALNKYGVRC